MNREELFAKAVFSEISNRKCAVSMHTKGNGRIELHGHIHLADEGNRCCKLYIQSNNDLVEIAAVKAPALDWMAEHRLETIPDYFNKFQGDSIVPVIMWKYDWSIITIKMDDLLETIDAIFD